ncbi:MAG: hypothetical protein CMH61_02545 [Nanoarchaeota archaeon]|nr:hypothetical protein [Nanoarchaeota archaeon]
MEYRKLISFGKSSFVVSLPKPWVTKNKLSKGDLIYFDEVPNGLVLNHREGSNNQEESEITIDVNGKSIRQIQREIISAYIRNFKSVTLTGEEVKDKAREIQNIIQNLVALEVMEQTSKRILAKDFLNMKETDPQLLVRKMDIIVRAMIEDCKLMFKEDVYDSIYHRDNDVNKLSFLLYRTVRYGMDNSGAIFKKFKFTSNDLLRYWWVTYNLESIGDDAKRIARCIKKMELNKESQAEFLEIFSALEKNYLDMMRGFYKQDSELAHDVHEKKRMCVQDCEAFYSKINDLTWSGYLVSQLKSLATNIHSIGRSIYQY